MKKAKVHKSAQSRNTIVRARLWSMTLNNWSVPELEELKKLDGKCEYVFQEEKGDEKQTPHLQGMFYFKQPMTLTGMKKINGRAHWEVGKNKFALKAYCSKIDTRVGKIYTNMILGKTAQDAQVHIDYEKKMFEEYNNSWKDLMCQISCYENSEGKEFGKQERADVFELKYKLIKEEEWEKD